VLNYTRVETGTVRYDLIDVRVAEALAAAEALVVPQVRAKGLGYAFGTCDPGLAVRADRDKLQQVLLNLLTNAIKFTSAGGEITVTCSSSDDIVAIRVTDTGVGIPPDKLAMIFASCRTPPSHNSLRNGFSSSTYSAFGPCTSRQTLCGHCK
jgi:signal transduction histidine kinase